MNTPPAAAGSSGATGLLHGLWTLLFPPACALCREPHTPRRDGIVCDTCLVRLVPLANPLCVRCGHPRLSLTVPLPGDGTVPTGAPPVLSPCRWCTRLPPHVRAVRSVCRMDEGTGAAMVHALKYGGWPAVAMPMARRMARLAFPTDVERERVALVPLPLSRVRQRERGYNQAERLASGLGAHWGIPIWSDVLDRSRNTQSQVRLTPSERAANVSGAFAVRNSAGARLRGAHVMLVDDVITTAASLNAAAAALVDGGARIISYVTFGRAPDPGDRSGPDFDLDTD